MNKDNNDDELQMENHMITDYKHKGIVLLKI